MEGGFDGTFSLGQVLKSGDTGLGTIDHLNGELVILDDKAYRFDVEGQVHEVGMDETTPYAIVGKFQPEQAVNLSGEICKENLAESLKTYFSSENVFQIIKIKGTFSQIRCRSVERQEKPYGDLADAAKDQAEFEAKNISGTLIGIYTPELFATISAAGFHLHFISDDHSFGGHVLAFEITEPRVEIQTIDTVEQKFPIEDPTFMHTHYDYQNVLAEIEETE